MRLHVWECVCVYCMWASTRTCVSVLVLDCHLSQRWPWAIWSCGLYCGVWDTCWHLLPTRMPLWSTSGMETFRICHACHFPFSLVCTHHGVFSCTLLICESNDRVNPLCAESAPVLGSESGDAGQSLPAFFIILVSLLTTKEKVIKPLLGNSKVAEWSSFSSLTVRN